MQRVDAGHVAVNIGGGAVEVGGGGWVEVHSLSGHRS